MKKAKNIGFALSLFLYAVFHFLHLFKTLEVDFYLSLFGFSTLFFSFFHMKEKQAIVPVILIISSIILGISLLGDQFLSVFWDGARMMSFIVTMVSILPVVSWVLKQKDYIHAFFATIGKMITNSQSFYFVNTFMAQVVSFFLLFAAVPIMYQFISSYLKDKKSEEWRIFISTSVLRGHSLSTLWIISIPSFAYAVEALEAPLGKSILIGFSVALVATFGSTVLMYIYEKRRRVDLTVDFVSEIEKTIAKTTRQTKRTSLEFILICALLLAPIFIVYHIFDVGLLTIIPVIVLVWSFSYFLLKKELGVYGVELKNYFLQGMVLRAREVCLLLMAGIFINILRETGISESVMNALFIWSESTPMINILNIIPILFVILSYGALGPLTSIVMFVGIVQSIELPYATELVFLSLTVGSTLSLLLSPLLMPAIALSTLNGKSTLYNSLQHNWKFAVYLYLIVQIYIWIRL